MRLWISLAVLLFAGTAAAGEDSWVYFRGRDSLNMSGRASDIERARSELGKEPGQVLWFTRGGADFVVRDRKLLAPLDEPMRRMDELGKKQEILGRHQSTLGARQSLLGAKQSALGERMGALSVERTRASGERARAIDDEIDELRGQMESLGHAQSELGEAQGKLGREQGRLGQEQGKIAQEMEGTLRGIIDRAISSGTAERL